MTGTQESATSDRGGRRFSSTAPEPRNGSTHRPRQSHSIWLAMKGVSLVLMPCVLMGGALGCSGAVSIGPITPAVG